MKVFGRILESWGRFLGSFWGLGGGFWHHFGVLAEVFGIISLSGEHVGAENLVEPSSGSSRAPLGVVWGSPGRVLAPTGPSIWVPFGGFWKVCGPCVI